MVVVTTTGPAPVEAATLIAVAAEPVRWRILAGLSDQPRCVCAILDEVEISPSLLSYHLKALRDAELVRATRRGRWIDYTLAPDAHARLAAALPTSRR